ncbi:MAG: DUF421 domain-containing protein [Clostridiales bacterium]|nr:DUF421 domain-containing protein [Clostridiales bacterium]
MFVVFLKSIIVFVVVFFVIRLMGKRQIGEMQPFELVITLIIAEVACIPMNDPYIPLYCGVVPIVTLGMLHIVLSFISRKSMKVRKLLSGNSIIVINPDGIVYDALCKMNMNVDDLREAVRTAGYVDFTEIAYAIFETNGKLCVVEKPQQQSSSEEEQPQKPLLPIELVVDGKIKEDNLLLTGADRADIEKVLREKKLKVKDVLYADIRQDGNAFFAPKYDKAFCTRLSLSGGGNW